jgi:hypothetical protein
MAGPYTEVVTLNGTTAVNTVATNIRFITSLEVATAGSLGNNQGTITLFGSTAGGGGTVGTIALNDNKTNWCHRYVGTSVSMYLLQVVCSCQGASAGNVTVLKTTPTVANSVDLVIIPQLRVPAGDVMSTSFSSPVKIIGPARVQLQIKQDAASGSNNWFAGFAYQES